MNSGFSLPIILFGKEEYALSHSGLILLSTFGNQETEASAELLACWKAAWPAETERKKGNWYVSIS